MLAIEYLPLDELKGAERNPKNHSIGELRRSIDRFGFAEAIVVDGRTGRLVAGHGRVEALRARKGAGEAAPDGVQLQGGNWLVPVQMGWASKDDASLAELLADVAVAAESGLEGVGYTEDDLRKLQGITEPGSDQSGELHRT